MVGERLSGEHQQRVRQEPTKTPATSCPATKPRHQWLQPAGITRVMNRRGRGNTKQNQDASGTSSMEGLSRLSGSLRDVKTAFPAGVSHALAASKRTNPDRPWTRQCPVQRQQAGAGTREHGKRSHELGEQGGVQTMVLGRLRAVTSEDSCAPPQVHGGCPCSNLPLWHGAQPAVDADIVRPISRTEPALPLDQAAQRKLRRTYPELEGARRCRRLVLDVRHRSCSTPS